MWFHHNIKDVNALNEDKMIISAFSIFPNVEVSQRLFAGSPDSFETGSVASKDRLHVDIVP